MGSTYNVLYHTNVGDSVNDVSIYRFPTEEAGRQWHRDVHAIKQHIAEINDKLTREGRAGQGTKADYRPWLCRCNELIRTFGKHAVPRDVQRAINSVEAGIGEMQTVWPANANTN